MYLPFACNVLCKIRSIFKIRFSQNIRDTYVKTLLIKSFVLIVSIVVSIDVEVNKHIQCEAETLLLTCLNMSYVIYSILIKNFSCYYQIHGHTHKSRNRKRSRRISYDRKLYILKWNSYCLLYSINITLKTNSFYMLYKSQQIRYINTNKNF